ncbi:unnamed protein product [[Actinomadura] parvosata subsp. kistnae]|nr:hypothetical protein [Nonomuraea sp. ATCC 55076]SPL99001.1 unnamed protein product [Actinomadura parvosata subsp. kistnae]
MRIVLTAENYVSVLSRQPPRRAGGGASARLVLRAILETNRKIGKAREAT